MPGLGGVLSVGTLFGGTSAAGMTRTLVWVDEFCCSMECESRRFLYHEGCCGNNHTPLQPVTISHGLPLGFKARPYCFREPI